MIIVYHHVNAVSYPVGSTNITAGFLVKQDSAGQIVPAETSDTQRPLGLAGDTKGSISGFDPRTSFDNRVSDYGDETAASDQITVYHGGGEFYLDIDASGFTGAVETGTTTTIGTLLYLSAGTDGQLSSTNRGALSADDDFPVAVVTDDLSATSGLLPTGIPNEYEPAGDSDTARTFIRIKLLI